MNKLYKLEDIKNFKIEDIFYLYREYINFSQVELISSFGFGQDIPVSAEGMYIYTKDGKKILDFTGGIGVLNHGHNHPRILKARQDFANQKKMEVHKNYFSPYLAALSSNLANLLPKNLNYSYFQNSGAEAVEGALKLSYKYFNGERNIVLASDISFHGKTIAASNITNSVETAYYKFQQVLNCDTFVYNSIESIKEKINKYKKKNYSDIYAIIVEPFNASSLRSCSNEFLSELRDICDKEKILLIFDEIYSGWFKTGPMFNFLRCQNLSPDILLTSKSLGGGKSSISAYITTKEVFKKTYGNLKDSTLHSSTFNGFGEETISAIESINIMIEDNYLEKSLNNEKIIKERLNKIKKKYPKLILETRGSGSLHGILFNPGELKKFINIIYKISPISFLKDDQAIYKIICASVIFYLYKKFNILTYYGSNLGIPLKVSPSIIVSKDEINLFFDCLEKTLDKGFLRLVVGFLKSKIFTKIKFL